MRRHRTESSKNSARAPLSWKEIVATHDVPVGMAELAGDGVPDDATESSRDVRDELHGLKETLDYFRAHTVSISQVGDRLASTIVRLVKIVETQEGRIRELERRPRPKTR